MLVRSVLSVKERLVQRHRRHISAAAAAAVLAGSVALAACGGGGGSSDSTTPPRTPGGRPATIGLENAASLGRILTDRTGRTLYLFQRDRGSHSACTGACAEAWPPLRAVAQPLAGTGIRSSLLATTRRPDGAAQLTYNGHPLYTYTADRNPGDTNGQRLNAFGGSWFVVDASGHQVSAAGTGGTGPVGY
jgi:predicted lipoprotein with Yx(FWY)xxD motif